MIIILYSVLNNKKYNDNTIVLTKSWQISIFVVTTGQNVQFLTEISNLCKKVSFNPIKMFQMSTQSGQS